MELTQKAEQLLKGIEVLALQPYDDQRGLKSAPIKEWCEGATIGYGYLIPESEWEKYKSGITKDEAEELFERKIKPYVNCVNEKITHSVTQNQFDALVIFCYNIGVRAFKTSTVAKLVNVNPNDSAIEPSWKSWRKSQGKVNKGLINRRNAEWDIYSKNVYTRW